MEEIHSAIHEGPALDKLKEIMQEIHSADTPLAQGRAVAKLKAFMDDVQGTQAVPEGPALAKLKTIMHEIRPAESPLPKDPSVEASLTVDKKWAPVNVCISISSSSSISHW